MRLKLQNLLTIFMLGGLLISSPLFAQESRKAQKKETESKSDYAGKAYNCNGQWQPYPCSEERPTIQQQQTAPSEEPISEEEQEYRKNELNKFVAREKEVLIAKTREYASFCQKKYNITPRSLSEIEIYCRMQQTTIEQCRQKLFQLETEIATYEKEYRKNHGLPYVPNDRASQTLKNKPKKDEFKF